MSTKRKKDKKEMTTMLDGVMTIGKTDEGQNLLDFMCTECAEIAPFTANCKVQAMHNGDVYITELKKRERNTPLFREDNSSLTLGRDGRYYFCFSLDKKRVAELSDRLMHQALSIAQKVDRMLGAREAEKKCAQSKKNMTTTRKGGRK